MAEKTTTGRLIAAGGGIILIVSLWLAWYGVDLGGQVTDLAKQAGVNIPDLPTINAWRALDFFDIVFFVVGILAILPAALDVFDLEFELPFDAGVAVLVGGVVSVIWILLRIVSHPDGASLKFGIFVSLIGAALVAFGGYTQREEEDGYEYGDPAAAGVPPVGAPPVATPPQAAPPQAAPPQAAPPQAAPPQAAPPAAPPPQPAPPAAPPQAPPAAPPQAAPPAAPPQAPPPAAPPQSPPPPQQPPAG
jgi:hypothetical protein